MQPSFLHYTHNVLQCNEWDRISCCGHLVVTSEVELHHTVLSCQPYKKSSHGFINKKTGLKLTPVLKVY